MNEEDLILTFALCVLAARYGCCVALLCVRRVALRGHVTCTWLLLAIGYFASKRGTKRESKKERQGVVYF